MDAWIIQEIHRKKQEKSQEQQLELPIAEEEQPPEEKAKESERGVFYIPMWDDDEED